MARRKLPFGVHEIELALDRNSVGSYISATHMSSRILPLEQRFRSVLEIRTACCTADY